jgi:acetyltransferase
MDLADHRMTMLRPLVPQDREAFQDFVRSLSPDARTNRFLAPVKELAPAMLEAMTQPDQARHVAFVATEGGRIIGEARYVALAGNGRAEFAVAVADQWQRQGIGARLLEALIAAARSTGLHALEGEVLRTNTAMMSFARRIGFGFKSCAGDARLVVAERTLPGA